MKKIIILFVLFTTSLVMAQEKTEGPVSKKKSPIDAKIVEIGGSFSTSLTFENDSTRYSLSFAPSINYYLAEGIHLGIRPKYNYSLIYTEAADNYDTEHEISPILMGGYTFSMGGDWYFDVSPEFGLLLNNVFSGEAGTKYTYLYYGLLCSFKYDLGKTLLSVNIEQFYRDRISDSGPDSQYKFIVGIGFSVYF